MPKYYVRCIIEMKGITAANPVEAIKEAKKLNEDGIFELGRGGSHYVVYTLDNKGELTDDGNLYDLLLRPKYENEEGDENLELEYAIETLNRSICETAQTKAKIYKLAEIEGMTVEELLKQVTFDGVSKGICMNPECEYTRDVEPDQSKG